MGRGRKRKRRSNQQRPSKKQKVIFENEKYEFYYKNVGIIDIEENWDEFFTSLKQVLPTSFKFNVNHPLTPYCMRILEKHFVPLLEEARESFIKQQQDEAKAEAEAEKNNGNKESSNMEVDDKENNCGSEAKEMDVDNDINENKNEEKEKKEKSDEEKLLMLQSLEGYTPTKLKWYPEDCGWWYTVSRRDLKKNKQFKDFFNFLVSLHDNGVLTRQETVSMIPPLYLDIRHDQKVLDLCSAPGSKTTQLIELMHNDAYKNNISVPSGVIVANEIDDKRCQILSNHIYRLDSPCCVVINHAAQEIPNLYDSDKKQIKFDRILADVPCSGDGTIRKNQELWGNWGPGGALGLHPLQVMIAWRGAQLLEVNGRMVYSTCSFNPIEDEAVVAEILRRSNGALKLIDVSQENPDLTYSKGISNWVVFDKDNKVINKEDISEHRYFKNRTTYFPPSEEEKQSMNLHYCMRFLPFYQNTGGFFVAVLEKVKKLDYKSLQYNKKKDNSDNDNTTQESSNDNNENNTSETVEKESSSSDHKNNKNSSDNTQNNNNNSNDQNTKKKQKPDYFNEYEFSFCNTDEDVGSDVVLKLIDDYSIKKDMNFENNLIVRNIGIKKKMIYVTDKSAQIIQASLDAGSCYKIVIAGVKLFYGKKFLTSEFSHRFPTCGSKLLFPCLESDERVVEIDVEHFLKLINTNHVYFDDFPESVQEKLKSIEKNGPIFLNLIDDRIPKDKPLISAGWRCDNNVQILLSNMLKRLFRAVFETIPYISE